jgi:hypothetical protein
MALKGPKVRAGVGERRAPGDVRPVTNQTLWVMGGVVILLVVLATAAILWASDGTTKKASVDTNTPHSVTAPTTAPATGQSSGAGASFTETAELPPVLRTAPAKSDPATSQTVIATVTVTCTTDCTKGTYSGFGGKFDLTVKGSQLSGASHTSCQDDAIVLNSTTGFTTPVRLPTTLTGTLTRTSTCPGTEVATPVTLRLGRS